jgi:hypothetical protein
MESEEYQGFHIEHEPDLQLSTTAVRDHWFNVDSRGEPVFRVKMRVRWDYAVLLGAPGHPVDAATDLARELGLRWTHGLIDLGRFLPGDVYEEERTESWDAHFGEASESDEDLRLHVLEALRRMLGAEQRMSSIPSLDVEGLSDVLGVDAQRTRSAIVELELEGLVEGRAEPTGIRLKMVRVESPDVVLRLFALRHRLPRTFPRRRVRSHTNPDRSEVVGG